MPPIQCQAIIWTNADLLWIGLLVTNFRSISYLHILSSNFRRCVACNARLEIQKFEILKFFKFVTLTLSSFDLGLNFDTRKLIISLHQNYLFKSISKCLQNGGHFVSTSSRPKVVHTLSTMISFPLLLQWQNLVILVKHDCWDVLRNCCQFCFRVLEFVAKRDHVGCILTLNVREPSYLGLSRSISWLLMPWLLTSPGHQQPWYWLYRICRSFSCLRKCFKYLCQINVEEWHKMQI